jgi:type VI secretion system protein ImpG
MVLSELPLRDPQLQTNSIRQVGFDIDQGVVDYPPQSFLGYRLLSEYFAFPEKFLFFDVQLGSAFQNQHSSTVELYFYLNKRLQALEPQVQSDTLQLGCTPIVNLFPKRAEPIRLTHFDASYTVVPDARRPYAHEVYSIESVAGLHNAGEVVDFQPFYSLRHSGSKNNRKFWHANRREIQSPSGKAAGTEMSISFVDLDFDPLEAGNWTIDIETLCTNRNLPVDIPFDVGRTRLQIEGGGAIEKVSCLTKPTKPLHPTLGQGLRWRVVSHLSLNHLSLIDDKQGATALRELLNLYNFRGDEVTLNSVQGLLNVSSTPVLGRVPGDTSGAVCRGMQIKVDFDESKYSSGNLFLFASILDRFFSLYCNINSFTQTIAHSNRRQGVVHRWPARAGLQNIL